MPATQTVSKIARELWKQFKAACILHDTAPTHEIGRLITQQVQAWGMPPRTPERLLPQRRDP